MKKLMVLLVSILIGFSLIACDDSTGENGVEHIEMTLEELLEFDGKDGARAYIAVEGTIYDVSDASYWVEGEHITTLNITAGRDLTDEIASSSHGTSVLDNLPVIGTLVDNHDD